jgi:hypothetical protein
MDEIPQEQKIANFSGCTLTTHRLRYDTRVFGHHRVVSIMLHELSSCEMTHRSYPLLLLLGILSFVAGCFQMRKGAFPNDPIPQIGLFGIILGLVLALFYVFTRKQKIVFDSAGGKVEFTIAGQRTKEILQFIEEVEVAKHFNRVMKTPQNVTSEEDEIRKNLMG